MKYIWYKSVSRSEVENVCMIVDNSSVIGYGLPRWLGLSIFSTAECHIYLSTYVKLDNCRRETSDQGMITQEGYQYHGKLRRATGDWKNKETAQPN